MEAGASYDMDNLEATELRLGLPGSDLPEKHAQAAAAKGANKRTLTPDDSKECLGKTEPDTAPAAKAQVVGWPPIRSFRRNSFHTMKTEAATGAARLYVKVSMDGAPYLRKIDLKVYKGYKELREALEDMFKCFSLGDHEHSNRSAEYAIAYEDKDGDLMLVGDVPWEMFISSCKRLRIMRGSEARGLGSSSH